MKKISAIMLGITLLFGSAMITTSHVVFAQEIEGGVVGTGGEGGVVGTGGTNTGGSNGGANNGNQSQGSGGTSFSIKINNPLKNVTTLNGLIVKLLNIILTIGVPFVALMIIYSGFLFVKAQGDPGKLKDAKATLQWVLIGGTILLSAWVIAKALAGTVNQIVNGS